MPDTAGPGRGLAALIPTGPREPEGNAGPRQSTEFTSIADTRPQSEASSPRPIDDLELRTIAVAHVRPNPQQPRTEFDPEAIQELAHSLTEVGFLQPIVVRPIADLDPGSTVRYELVAGERRWRAATSAGMVAVPALVRHTPDDALLRDALLENLHRVQLNSLEEAAAYEQLLEDFGGTHEELADRLGKSRAHVTNTLRLLKLPPAVQSRVAAGVLSAGHARALLRLSTPEEMDRFAGRVVAEGISVRGLEELVSVADPTPRQRKKRSTAAASNAVEWDVVAERLGDRLDTRVRVVAGKGRGTIAIEFADVEDLYRIVEILDPSTRVSDAGSQPSPE